MDLDELRTVQSKERRKDSLQHLRDSFYEDVADYIGDRKRQRDERASSVDDPFSDSDVRKLSDEIETAEEVIESLYERRVGKVVKLASFAAAGAPTDTEGMTRQERDLFEDLVARIEQNKDAVLDVLAGGSDVDIGVDDATAVAETAAGEAPTGSVDAAESAADAGPPDETFEAGADHADDASGGVLADAMGGDAGEDTGGADGDADAAAPRAADDRTGEAEAVTDQPPANDAGAAGDDEPVPPEANGEPPGAVDGSGGQQTADAGDESGDSDATGDRQTVRITRDVGEILGVDEREYSLAAEDVVSLPAANAEPLVERDAAEPLE
ncbi:DNA replication complex subunit Gins51 [Halobaculum sp. D14]|uniref:DNA replication complex subunit Gins51 n=1 Tax=Halobaculum sp. D14 TaxID=3421642 RepID=UPI003EC0C758